jgi:predicted nucleic acid-binding protein
MRVQNRGDQFREALLELLAGAAWVREPTTSATVIRAIDIAEMAQLPFWDALIVASAEEMHATHISGCGARPSARSPCCRRKRVPA